MKNVLVTGGAGFVGLHLTKYLLDNEYSVTLIDNFAREYNDQDYLRITSHQNCQTINGDITSKKLFDDLPKNHFDDIYHLAAINGTANFYNRPVDVFRVGVVGTINMLDWIVTQDKGKILYTSSCEAYAGTMRMMKDDFPIPTPESIPLSVDDVSNVRWSYGAGKLASEVAFNSYKTQYDFNKFSIVRPHNFFGPRMGFEHVIPQFVNRINKGENPFKIYGGSETRSFCYIDNVIEALVMIQESNETDGETYHVGNDHEEIKIIDLAERLLNLAGVDFDFDVQPAPNGSVKRRCPNIDKIKELGYKVKYSTDYGIEKTYDWYKDREW
tara:strand:- start:714 stop:1694 length:981 start_codon:yes stop_codon:yes gene_type:complete